LCFAGLFSVSVDTPSSVASCKNCEAMSAIRLNHVLGA
jgi:hypothetical protein